MDRKKVMKLFGGFLAVMLVFTILSRAVSGASMARVETVRISPGTIEHKVTAIGRVQAGKETAVYTESGQRVKEICVQEGKSVKAGDVLFLIDMEELEEQILAAQQELEKTKLQNQDLQNAKSFEQSNQSMARHRAQEDYNQAVTQGDSLVAEAKKAWDDAEWALQQFLSSTPKPEPEGGGDSLSDQAGSGQEGATADAGQSGLQTSEEDVSHPQSPSSADGSSVQTQAPPSAEEGSGAEEWEARKSSLEQAAAEAKAAYDVAVSSRADNVRAAARAIEDAARPQSAADSTQKQNEITRQQQDLALNKLLALKKAGGEITAGVSGVVTQILVSTGDFTSEGAAMRVTDDSAGSRIVFPVSKFEEDYVSKGSPVKLKAAGSKDFISDYTISSVTENEQDNMLLDVAVDLPQGVFEAGVMVTAEIVPNSEDYTCIIPLQALHEEQNGSYVLILQEQRGVLGTELAVQRLDVKVLDKNNTDAALEEGLLTSEQEIISSSNRMIQEGSRVRRSQEE